MRKMRSNRSSPVVPVAAEDHGADDGDHACTAGECGGLAHRVGKDA